MSQFSQTTFGSPRGGWLIALLLGIIATTAALATLFDPGLTVDEPINVGHGKRLAFALLKSPDPFFSAATVESLWGHAHDHPPLARALIGFCHWALDGSPNVESSALPHLGRPASALAFGMAVLLAARLAWRIDGPIASLTAGTSVLLMPRVFGHAHFASPEMIQAAIFLGGISATTMVFADASLATRQHYGRAFAAGVIVGLALLVKLTAVLLPMAIAIAAISQSPRRNIGPTAALLIVAAVVFFLGWPWLWPFDLPGYSPGWAGSAQRLSEYFSIGVNRSVVYVWYFGQQYPNEQSGVPWHYAWIYFAFTVPVGLHWLGLALGMPRCLVRFRESFAVRLLLISIVTTMFVFTLPIHRYDGERLFLFLFPMWAVVVGVGASALYDGLRRLAPAFVAGGLVAGLIVLQAIGVVRYHPCQLSYYNLAAGGLSGAYRMGLETNYWGDSLTEELLDRFAGKAAPGERGALVPTLYAGHAWNLMTQAMASRQLLIVPADQMGDFSCRWAIVFHRDGYLHDPLPMEVMAKGSVEAEIARDGVWLSRLYRLPAVIRPNSDQPPRIE